MSVAAIADAPADTPDWPYRFEIIPLDELAVDSAYQRPLTSFWQTVRDNFNPALVGTLVVSERKNGSKWIIDGQTRWEAMRARALPNVPCLVYEGLNKRAGGAAVRAAADAAARDADLPRVSGRSWSPRTRTAVGIAKVATDAGFDLGVDESRNTLQSIAALERAYRVSPDHLADVLGIIRDVWGTTEETAVVGADHRRA
jgi:hypothetical protein